MTGKVFGVLEDELLLIVMSTTVSNKIKKEYSFYGCTIPGDCFYEILNTNNQYVLAYIEYAAIDPYKKQINEAISELIISNMSKSN